jgi:hypothetical protein
MLKIMGCTGRSPLWRVITFALMLVGMGELHANPDTLHVITHNRTYITTNPATGSNPYPGWALFPPSDRHYRKVILSITFECPDKLMCAEWDYLDRIYIRHSGGKTSPLIDLEIGRMLTPYGRRFNSDWKFTWELDISDFSSFLHDSTQIEYLHTGYEPPNDRGWRITLDFMCITGESAMKFLSIQKVYQGTFLYGDSTRSIEADLTPFTIKPIEGATVGRFLISQTGHGMDDTEGCSEFCSKWRSIYWDNKIIESKPIWKECASNPLFPQAGTWIFDRANWCPGELNPPDFYQFPLDENTHVLDVNMQPYSVPKPTANYAITAYFISYGKPVSRRDVSIETILIPSEADMFNRINPAAHAPVIHVKNMGSEPVKEMKIEYGFRGKKALIYKWKGLIDFYGTEEIELPMPELPLTESYLTVKLRSVNKTKDDYPDDNQQHTSYKPVPVFPSHLDFYLRTNLEPAQTSSYLKNSEGNLVFQHLPGSLDSGKIYRDSLILSPGYYQYVISDTAGDGLEFWYNSTAGKGAARILDFEGHLVKNFNPDFGNSTGCWFRIGDESLAVRDTSPVIDVFPIRTNGKFDLDVFFNTLQPLLQVQIIHPDGSIALMKNFYQVKEGLLPFDMSGKPEAIYTVRILSGRKDYLRRVKIAL